MTELEFDRMIQAMHQRVEDLQRQAVQAGSVDHVHTQAFQELQNTLEELHVAQEELRQQNDELLATHRALELERQRYQDLFDFAPDGYLVTDTRGMIDEANRAAGRLLGVGPEQLRGKPLPLFVQEKERAAFRLQFTQVNGRHPTREREITLQPRQGPAFPAALTSCVIHDEQGTAMALRWLLRDISGRRQAEESLRRERDFADNLLTLARAIVLLCDAEGRVIRCSPYMEKISGYRLEEVQGKDWFAAFVPSRVRARGREAFLHSLADNGSSRDVYPILTRAGGEREIEWYSKALRGDRGQVTSVLAVGHDITELKVAQERVLQTERLAAIGQMAAGLAHEGRNALQRGMACLEMLTLELQDRPRAIDLVKRVQKAQYDLHDLYEEVRGYAAPILLKRQPCRLGEVVREAWARLASRRPDHRARLRDLPPEPDVLCEVDRFFMERVLLNIFENALDSWPGAVEIDVRFSEGEIDGRPALAVAVRDNGPGLNAEQEQRIFEPFYTTKTQGRGLGMAMAKRVVEAHGGHLTVGTGSDRGTEIVITLPGART